MILKKLKDRFNVVLIAFIIVIIVIFFRLASIMIVQGATYREEAENRIFKTIPLTAPRGEIRDRYGRLLAGNRPSFTVQIMKSEIVDERINEVVMNIVKILESNDDKYTDEFPIVLSETGQYEFTYDTELRAWKENNLLEEVTSAEEAFEILLERHNIQEGEDKFEAQRQLIEVMGSIPISVQTWKFTDEMKKENWLVDHRIKDFSISAEEAFLTVREKIYKLPEEYSNEDARKIMAIREQLRKQSYLQFQPVKIAKDISQQSVVQIEENINEFPGINVAIEPVRIYPEGETAAHVLGYVGKISQQWEIDKYIKELDYAPGDLIGKTGVEHKFEEYLKGEDGYQKVIVDSNGRLIRVLETKEPIPGNTLFLTIDLNLQKKAEEVVKDVLAEIRVGGVYETQWGKNTFVSTTSGPRKNATSASTVVMDVKTGEVLALANYPSYDPNLFATGISSSDWEGLMPENERDPLAPRPLNNIAMRTAVQPGSIYKPLVGLAALEQGLSPTYEILDIGYIKIGGHSFGNWRWNQSKTTAGYQNLYEAIADSNNIYFYSLGTGWNYGSNKPLPAKMDVHTMIDYTNRFGLDEKTGIEIDIPTEFSGGVPNIERKTSTIKVLLERQLKRLLKPQDFDATIINPTEENINALIEEIIGWIEENPSRGVVYNRIVDKGINPDIAGTYADLIVHTYFKQASWSIADTMNFSIGQGEHAYTPIQMASYMSILANGGYRYSSSVLRKINDSNGQLVLEDPPELIERVKLNDYSNLDHVNLGMLEVTKTGTARTSFTNFPVDVAGKTGTAQRSGKIPPVDEIQYLKDNLHRFGVGEAAVEARMVELRLENPEDDLYKDDIYAMKLAIIQLSPRKLRIVDLDEYKEDYDNYAWFTAFAPYENPEIAISVLIFQGGSGGYGGPIVREVIAEYMGLNFIETQSYNALDNTFTR
ncbi:penicillin-binding transpeptidase domain-containing protein [Alkaliphilus serpentinus]|uniref:Penicillin-binding protein n=1 Tax=Alkaliphilus serpentinus TaxID=1482731 RepID=A0A833HQ07_9FIRM|nr:penicillin-binding transpeptidase domain-containing protein [Alkaliphilus serpentinus]KAB3531440.1 penicillin-binding protein [Alkaliphilus serpentinus]